MARKLSGPIATMVDRPIAESIEYRPPTQSQNPNMLAVSMPNAATRSAFVETATKCLATAESSPSRSTSHLRAQVAGRLHQVGGVDVGDEAEGQVAPGVVAQRLIDHHRTEVGSADPDIDDVADRPAGVALPATR